MHNLAQEDLVSDKQKSKKTSRLLIVIGFIVIFALGVVVGKGNLKINGLSSKTSSTSAIDYSSVNQLYGLLSSEFDGNINKQQILDGIKTGLVTSAGDPYTEYFNPTEAKELNQPFQHSGIRSLEFT